MTAIRPKRIGAVNYLNTRPLIYQFDQHLPDAELILDLPSRLADGLRDGRYDVALIPSIEYFLGQDYTIVSDACIACQGPVLSVKLFFRVPPGKVRTLALDEGSRTSAALARVLLHQRFGLTPELESLPIGNSLLDTNADAVLLIGDRSMHSPGQRFEAVWDLGDEWFRFTGLPFVFAMWIARAGIDASAVETGLARCRDAGVSSLPTIAEQEAFALGLSVPQCLAYLRDNLYFYLGPRELQGLRKFHELASQLNLAPAGVDFGGIDFANAR